jgi:membrane-associated phospholipid phosphatase
MKVRCALFVAIVVTQLLYFPINRIAQGGIVLETRWDGYIPLWPIWAIPYLLSLIWWWGCYVWAAWRMDLRLYKAFAVGILAAMLISYVIYLGYPTYVNRPPLEGNDWQTALMRFIYQADRSYNAFPSGHTYTAVLIGLFWWRWHPRQRWLWAAITVITVLSTLFTRQHNLPDLIGGAVLAATGYCLGIWLVSRLHDSERMR